MSVCQCVGVGPSLHHWAIVYTTKGIYLLRVPLLFIIIYGALPLKTLVYNPTVYGHRPNIAALGHRLLYAPRFVCTFWCVCVCVCVPFNF